MIKYKKIKEEIYTKKPVSITCDICKKEYRYDDNSTIYEIQEFNKIRFTGGYGSIFGDEDKIECDICQYCLYKMIKGNYRVIEEG